MSTGIGAEIHFLIVKVGEPVARLLRRIASCKARGSVVVLVMLPNAAAPKLPLGCEKAEALVMFKSSARRTWRLQDRSRISQTDTDSTSLYLFLSAQSTNGVVPGWSATRNG